MNSPSLHKKLQSVGRERVQWAGVGVAYCGLCISLMLLGPQIGDEGYHHPLARSFSEGFPLLSRTYSSTYPPLPYVFVGLVMKLLGTELLVARFCNFVVGILGVIGFARLAKATAPGSFILPAVFLAFNAYYLRNSATFYMGNYALVASIWAFYFYFTDRTLSRVLFASIMFGAATLSAQWAVGIVAGVLVSEAVSLLDDDWRLRRDQLKRRLRTIALIVLFQIPTTLLFVAWGGLTHPNWSHHNLTLSVSPGRVTGILAVLGVTFAFWIVARLKSCPPRRMAYAALFLPVLFLALREIAVAQQEHPIWFLGLLTKILHRLSQMMGFDVPVLLAPAAILGFVLLLCLSPQQERKSNAVLLSSLFLLICFAASTILGETHLMMVTPFLFLLAWKFDLQKLWIKLVVLQSSLLGIAYAAYHALLK